ncbi:MULTISPECIES: arginine--tRNA ligase [Butyricimonas]|jgi:arginine--tRNA ligase|uniref:Arginine--tRNA ligase n=1 Tax=Butyricimonas faecihominis TaxID=1472416 RepID=A0A7W6MYA3_9BACT|nr:MULTISPECIES: arginine--tRNA ligase [Butyricimonas]MBS6689279.1 arginine--tRNA ligase [Sanguibacteroides justesenii]KAB1501364.1 arginine--tRNA ligase [Butyricimonas faecihominis]MBB4025610.1 arginyl-tRNA synthetase [Butyricimonas faecihominis]WOF07573.1 arginine--tRNA ligase [Butyricimonas faecihominis]BEI56378.1 arginine--tRNA ligase [Butyricimonas faecihominis]
MTIEKMLTQQVLEAVKACYGVELTEKDVQLQETRKEFAGDLTVVVFPFTRYSRKSPEETAKELGEYLKQNIEEVETYNVIKGFLNVVISSAYWIEVLNDVAKEEKYGYAKEPSGKTYMIEYSSPNTNKPLHLGHIRNNFLGWSVSEIQKANGHNVIMVNLVNDRGIHICKSMIAWEKFANGATPESTGTKGDHFVGDYYVRFDKEYKAQIKELMEQGKTEEEAKKEAPILLEAQEMLRKWEAGDEKVVSLWRTMNDWVLKGFDETYKMMGISFDKVYFESQTYKKGRDLVLKGLADGVLYRKDTGSVWADLTGDGLDHKLLLRDDGTSVYMTQDIGTAYDRFNEFNMDQEIYVVGNEQNYHFQVLSLVCKKLGFDWADKIKHLSYGMVELPEGKMKSREGTVVDADDLIDEMIHTARTTSEELGKLDGYTKEEAEDVYRKVALGALKYFILKVDPKKTMMFNPKESIDFNGNTGPFIQYTYTRIKSVLRKAEEAGVKIVPGDIHTALTEKEQNLVKLIAKLPAVVKEAGDNYSPALIGNYAYELAKEFNQFYHDYSILKEENEQVRNLRLLLARQCSVAIENAMGMLGIEMPERM